MTKESRKAFEDWFLSNPSVDTDMTSAKRGWQAATAAADAKYLPVIEKLVLMIKRAKALHETNSVGNQGYGLALDEALALAAPLLQEKK